MGIADIERTTAATLHGVEELKQAVAAMQKPNGSPQSRPEHEVRADADGLVFAFAVGDRTKAIKHFRGLTGWDLALAREWVEWAMARLGK